jgi:hypothetical protein
MVLSLQPAPPRQRRTGRLETRTQEAAHQPVLAGQRAGRGRGQDWWTLGFEATGPADLLRSELQATAALMFAQALPGGLEPGPDESRSYAQWLGQRPDAGSDAGA